MKPEQSARIVLMRHGQPDVELRGLLCPVELARLADAYRDSGILDAPPQAVREALGRFRLVVCSDLPRSRQSAQALDLGDRLLGDPLFGEARLPHFRDGRIRLPVKVWLTVLRLLWLAGFSRNGESYRNAKRRAVLAAARLTDLADANGEVLLVGHGVMNYLIARELHTKGWRGSLRSGNGYWEHRIFEMKPGGNR